MADAIVLMNNLIQIEREVSYDLRIENIKLKALEVNGHLEALKVNGGSQCSTASAVDTSSLDSCSHCHLDNDRWATKP